VGNLAGAVAALQEGRAHGLLWETGSAQHLVDRGDFVMLSECESQWPSFVLAVRKEMLLTFDGMDAVRNLLETMGAVCEDFQEWPGRFNLVSQKYGYRVNDARRRLSGLTWSCNNYLGDEVLDEVAFTLVAVGILEQFPSTDDMFVSLDQLPETASPLQQQQGVEEDEKKGAHKGSERNANDSRLMDQEGLREKGKEKDKESRTVRFQEPAQEGKMVGFKQRPPTPFPWIKAQQLEQEDLQHDDDAHSNKVYDSSSESDDEPSYEPDFKKTDEGTVDLTGTVGSEVRQSVANHEMRGKWVKGGNAQVSAKPNTPEWKSCAEDEHISAILDRSLMLSSTTALRRDPAENAHDPQQSAVQEPRSALKSPLAGPRLHGLRVRAGSPRMKFTDTPHLDAHAPRGVGFDGDDLSMPLLGLKSERHLASSQPRSEHLRSGQLKASRHSPLTTRLQAGDIEKHAELTDFEPQGSDMTHSDGDTADFAHDTNARGGTIGSHSFFPQSASIVGAHKAAHKIVPTWSPDMDSITSTNSGSLPANAPSDSEQLRQQRAAVNLRKLRDSAVIRRTAAKLKHEQGDDVSPGGSERQSTSHQYVPIRPASLFALGHKGMASGGDGARAGASCAQRDQEHSAEVSSIKTQSEDTSPSGQSRSLERHPAEFRHTLRKSVRKEYNTQGNIMPPTALFGTVAPRGAGCGEDGSAAPLGNCPICLEPLVGGQVHVTTCAHRFHVACFNDYRRKTTMRTRDQCPVCRTAQTDDARALFDDTVPLLHIQSQSVAAQQQPTRRDLNLDPGPDLNLGPDLDLDQPSPSDAGHGARREGDGAEMGQEIDSEALGMGCMLNSRDKSGRRRFSDTPFMLESQHVNPVLDKGSPLTGHPKSKMTSTGLDYTAQRASRRSFSVGRSPPWALSLNPYSMTAGGSNENERREGGRQGGREQQEERTKEEEKMQKITASPLRCLTGISGDDLAAAVDGFAVPKGLMNLSAQTVQCRHSEADRRVEQGGPHGAKRHGEDDQAEDHARRHEQGRHHQGREQGQQGQEQGREPGVVAKITHRYSQVQPHKFAKVNVLVHFRKCTRALTFANLCSSDRCAAMLECHMCVCVVCIYSHTHTATGEERGRSVSHCNMPWLWQIAGRRAVSCARTRGAMCGREISWCRLPIVTSLLMRR
jgi:hypothetical protein